MGRSIFETTAVSTDKIVFGHIFIPSWQYTGFGSSAVQAPMQSVLASTSKLGSIASAVRESWRQSLPDFYIPPMFDPDTPQRAPQSDGHFSMDFVNKIVTYLSMLVVMGNWASIRAPHDASSCVPNSSNDTLMKLS